MFSVRLRKLRKEKGLSMEALGKVVGLSKQTIHSYEKGRTHPDFDTLSRFAALFDTSTDYLLCRTNVQRFDVQESPEIPALESWKKEPDLGRAIIKVDEIVDLRGLTEKDRDRMYAEVVKYFRQAKPVDDQEVAHLEGPAKDGGSGITKKRKRGYGVSTN